MKFNDDSLNLPAPDLSAVDLFNIGRSLDNEAKTAQESSKKHTLRVGNSGCMLTDGTMIGANPWKVLARFMGYQVQPGIQSYDIFDGGFGNEAMWEKYLPMVPGVEVKADSDYPLVIPNFAGAYPLTGRPDAVIFSDGVPRMGIELKGVFGASTVQKVFAGSPKTENLIQSAAYSLGFGLPWTLVYSNASNFKTYKGPGAPGKSEYQLFWVDGKLNFLWKGVATETAVDVQGIREYFEAIVEAFESKDHSWFRRSAVDYMGEPEQYDNDDYCEWNNLVDNTLSWNDWVEQAALASKSTVQIKYSRVKNRAVYSVVDLKTARIYADHDTLKDARDHVRSIWKKGKI